jgi:hypothetical protein
MTESKKNNFETIINEKLYSIFGDLDNLSNAAETTINFKTKCEHIIYILDNYLDAADMDVYKLCKKHIKKNSDIVDGIKDVNNILDFRKINEMCENSGPENQSEIVLRGCLLKSDGVSDKDLTDSVIESVKRVTKDDKEKNTIVKEEISQAIKKQKEKRKTIERTIKFKNRRAQEIDQKDIDTIIFLTESINLLKKLLKLSSYIL